MYAKLLFDVNCDTDHNCLCEGLCFCKLIIKMSSEISLMVSIVSNLKHCTESSPFCVHYVTAQTAGAEKNGL